MEFVDVTLDTPEKNLSLDEALFLQMERKESTEEKLRIWESPTHFVVLGRSSKYADEVDIEYCTANGIPWLRRCSGGGTVLAGPGCLMYAVLLNYDGREELRMLPAIHRFVMERTRDAVRRTGEPVTIEGISDLALAGRKISGNALRCGRNSVLYHGTLLYGMAPKVIDSALGKPTRMPAYRSQRLHHEFVSTLSSDVTTLRRNLQQIWQANKDYGDLPMDLIESLVDEKYSRTEWNSRH